VAVGSDGDTLVADSAASTGLRWQGDFAAGKNKIINGDFTINQRAFSSTTTSSTYMFDRWRTINSGGTSTFSAQTFTLGTAPVSGYEGKNYLQINSTGQSAASDNTRVAQIIESVRTFANQTITISFWAKATSGTPSLAAYFYQDFGTGGSPSAGVFVNGDKVTLSTSWARYSLTIAIPSISGKTLGTNNDDALWALLVTSAGSNFNAYTNSIGIQTTTIQVWGVQVEAGSVATAFQTATGTLQGELAACQRYFERFANDGGATGSAIAIGFTDTTTSGLFPLAFAEKRVTPTFTFSAASGFQVNTAAATGISSARPSKKFVRIDTTGSGYTANVPANLRFVDSTTATIDISAEL